MQHRTENYFGVRCLKIHSQTVNLREFDGTENQHATRISSTDTDLRPVTTLLLYRIDYILHS